MASRSMQFLRKYAKPVLAVMGVVCMITFVVGPYLLDLVGGGRGEDRDDKVAVTWARGTVHDSDLYQMRVRHNVAASFVQMVIIKTLDRGGEPVVNGNIIQRDQQSFDIGFPTSDDDETLVETMMLAEEARRMGLAVDHEAVKRFLRDLSAPELGEADWLEIANDVIGKNAAMNVGDLMDQLAYELRAQHVRLLMHSGLFAIPPGKVWDYFNRLNRQYSIEAYPIDVKPLVAQVGGEPSDTEMQELFEEGQGRDPNPNQAKPGFHQPLRIAFGYVKVDFKPFLEAAKKQVTEEQIAEQYKKDVEQGLHKVLDLPDEKPAERTPKEGEKPTEGEKPAGEKPADDEKKDVEKKDESKPAAASPEDEPADKKKEEKPVEEKPAVKQPASEKEDPTDDCEEDPPSSEKPAEDKAAKEPAEKPAEAKPADPAKPAEEKPAEEKPAEAKPADPTKPAEEKPADPSKPAETKPGEPAKEPKFKPLAEVRDDVLTKLAQPIAQEAQIAAVKKLVDEITKYGKDRLRYETIKDQKRVSTTIKDPGELDLQALAAKYGFEAGTTPLVDRYTVQEHELGQKVSMIDYEFLQTQRQFRMLTFADVAFGDNVPPYLPQQADSSEPDISYIFFRMKEEPAKDLTIAEAESQIVAAWKMQKAYELALEDAEKVADKAKDAKSLKEVVSDPTKVIEPPAFSWMTTGSLAFGFGQPAPSQVAGIELAGEEFMRAVFSLAPGQTGVAPNNAHTKVYVVRVLSQSPSDKLLREQFLESGLDFQVLTIAQRETGETSVAWIEQLEDRFGLKWHRPPTAGSRGM